MPSTSPQSLSNTPPLSPAGFFSLFALLGILPGLFCHNAPLLLGYDDKFITTENPMIVHELGYFFEQFMLPFREQHRVGFATPHWAPLSYLSLALEHKIFGMNPIAFRILSGIYHGITGWFVFRLAIKLMFTGNASTTARKSLAAPFIAALIFLFHPTVCESVCWIIERNNILPMLFGVWALDIYTGPIESGGRTPPSWPRVAAAFTLLLLSQLCKASGVCWWPIMAAWDFFLMGALMGAPPSLAALGSPASSRETLLQSWLPRLARWAILGLPIALSIFVLLRSHADVLMEPIGQKPFGPWLMWIYLTIRYVGLMAFPLKLSAFYHVSPTGVPWSDPFLWLTIAGIIAAILWARKLAMPWTKILFYAFWIVVAIAPIVNPFVTTAYLFQDRYVYPAMPAFACFVIELLFATLARFQMPRPWLAAALIPAILLPLAMARGTVWRSLDSLFRDAATSQPQSAFGHCYLAHDLFLSAGEVQSAVIQKNRYREAADQYELAMHCDDYDRQQWPLHYTAEHARILYYALGDRANALRLSEALVNGRAERPSEIGAKAEAIAILSEDALRGGAVDAGLKWLEAGLKIAPNDPRFLLNRLIVWKNLGKTEELKSEAKRLRALPDLHPQVLEWLKQNVPQ